MLCQNFNILKQNKKEHAKPLQGKNVQNLARELMHSKFLPEIDHPNIIKLYEYFEDNKNVYLITELCTGGELFDKIIEKEFFDEHYACWIFKQIM